MAENHFGERLYQTRRGKKMTRDALSKKAKITSKTIANYESGERYPTIDIAKRLADALDVSLAYLMGEEGEIIEKAREEFGSKGVRDVRELLDEVTGLFAGGELPEEDKDSLMRALSEAYFMAKEKNHRFAPKKYQS